MLIAEYTVNLCMYVSVVISVVTVRKTQLII